MTTAFSSVEERTSAAWPGVIERYREHLPVSESTPVITLLEGNTPLIRARNFVEAIGGRFELYLKYEAMNKGIKKVGFDSKSASGRTQHFKIR